MWNKIPIDERIQNNKFAKGVFVLTGATGFSQVIVFLASPLIARLYTPEDFGVFAVYSSVLIILGVISSLRYQLAIPICTDKKEAADVIVLCCVILLMTSLIIVVSIVFLADEITNIVKIPELYLWLFPISFLLSGFYQIIYYQGIREKEFPSIATSKVSQVIGNLSGQISGHSAGAISLSVAQAFGFLVAIYPLYKKVSASYNRSLLNLEPMRIIFAANKFKKFPIYSTWHGVFNSIGMQVPNLFFAIYFNPVVAGLYFLADKVLAQPMNILGRSISDVFFARASDLHDISELKQLVVNVYDVLIKVIMPVVLIIAFFGEEIFTFLFGKEWKMAGEMVTLLSPSLLFGFITSPLMMVFTVLEKQEQALAYQAVLLVTRLAGLGVGIYLNSFLYSVIGFVVASVICRLGILMVIIRLIKFQFKNIFIRIVKTFCVCSVLLSPLLMLSYYNHPSPYYSLIMVFLGTVLIGYWYYQLLRTLSDKSA